MAGVVGVLAGPIPWLGGGFPLIVPFDTVEDGVYDLIYFLKGITKNLLLKGGVGGALDILV